MPLVFSDFFNLLKKKLYIRKVEIWDNVKNNISFSKSVPDISTWRWLSLNKRSYDVILARLRSGSIDLNDHLHKLNLKDSPNTDFCLNERETVEHYIFSCQKYSNLRNALFNDLANLNINQNNVNLQLLLTGQGSNKIRIHILKIFMNFVKLTKRFEL